MDDNALNNATISSTRKFIFNDEFYNGLAANNNTEQDNTTLFENNILPPKEVNDINENINENINEKSTNETEVSNFNNTENNQINSIEEPIMDPINDIENINSNQMENSLNNENDAKLPLNDVVDNNLIPIETQSDTIKDEKTQNSFTSFLLGNNVNYQTSNTPVVNDEPVINNNDNIPLDNSLNVETGIDTNLESFLFNKKAEPVVEEDEFAEYRRTLEPTERKVYRAARRNREEKPSILITEGINKKIDDYKPIEEKESLSSSFDFSKKDNHKLDKSVEENWKPDVIQQPIVITEEIDYSESLDDENTEVVISNLLDELSEKSKNTGKISILAKYGDDFCSHNYVTNPAIGREREIKELGLILLTPEKSAILVGKPGIGKTSIVEGLAYRIQRNKVPDALKGYRIISVKTTSLLGTLPSGETRLQTMIDEIKDLDKIILFVDEIHMLMGATNESSLDFANMFKESLGRGTIKMIGATTSDEYERYVLRDKAFVRRFQRVDVAEPTKEQTVEILMGTLPKIEKSTGAKLKYTHYLQVEIMTFIVDITSEYKRVYGIGSRYPDICITLVSQAFSEAVFDNRNEVNILDIRNAIENSKNIYPDVIRKELRIFDDKFKDLIKQENNN